MEQVRIKVTGKRDTLMSHRERNELLSILGHTLKRYKFDSHHISIGVPGKVESTLDQHSYRNYINPVHDMGAEDAEYNFGMLEEYAEYLKNQL